MRCCSQPTCLLLLLLLLLLVITDTVVVVMAIVLLIVGLHTSSYSVGRVAALSALQRGVVQVPLLLSSSA
jgi:hypothetical protein